MRQGAFRETLGVKFLEEFAKELKRKGMGMLSGLTEHGRRSLLSIGTL
ncbi:MAG: hypothetical protein N2327_08400 [Caldimicrobium sp.]|nr:hypothetical protein [Caldimicrobium sp.]MCX7874429.1 hypothetical protein [Caldimicrobium sp.]MDW8093986.1 hypothetical protein [Caldimicrobium sp.]